jgi:hypothetical protein
MPTTPGFICIVAGYGITIVVGIVLLVLTFKLEAKTRDQRP